MSNVITNLKNYIKAGSRTNKFELTISQSLIDGSTFSVLCKSASFPTRSIQTVDISRYGRKYTLRGETEYSGAFTFTVLEDDSMTMRYAFDRWLYLVDNTRTPGSNTSSYEFDPDGPNDSYTSDVAIWQLDGAGNKVYGYRLEHAFPTSIGEVQYSQETAATLVEYDVTLAYSEFVPLRNSSRTVSNTAE